MTASQCVMKDPEGVINSYETPIAYALAWMADRLTPYVCNRRWLKLPGYADLPHTTPSSCPSCFLASWPPLSRVSCRFWKSPQELAELKPIGRGKCATTGSKATATTPKNGILSKLKQYD